jgi:hypothetical protein
MMVENSSYGRGHLKKRLIKLKILKNECSVCGRPPEWEGRDLILILDHVNGVNNDHRRENLRLVCPNCNSQLAISGGGNRKKKYHCSVCGTLISKTSSCCRTCRPSDTYFRKVSMCDRPSRESLEKMVKEMPMTKIGVKYGVSDNTVRKWCKHLGINF